MNILTFDIEEWFHILDNDSTRSPYEWEGYEERIHANVDRILELLDRHGQKATFFVLGWIASEYPGVVRRIDREGHQIGSHSDLHQLCYEMSREDFISNTRRSIEKLEDLTGKKVTCYRAPGFSIKYENRWALECLLELGIETDCSIFPTRRAHGGFEEFGTARPSVVEIDGMRLKEFPINTLKLLGRPLVFSGGGYFRLIPYPLLRRLSERSDYVMTYFHPRDFDPGQPVIPELGYVRRFKSYYGLDSAYDKLDRWLGEAEFTDLETADRMVNWEYVRPLKLDVGKPEPRTAGRPEHGETKNPNTKNGTR